MSGNYKIETNENFNYGDLEFQFSSYKNFYDEVDIQSFEYEDGYFYFPCPCGDRFEVSLEELKDGEEIATCPSCSLIVKIIYEEDDLLEFEK
ncbi:hypothetical protein SLOPH_2394 [Spraguea lophii 42_110]|uniref:Diphthamide biosynthesis protein 3 n=1 Tax=Spraguea lophii (strain 42_110) TaxID=1358809 RepID=S7XI43_SPRLO|nr:hypothetical protein SLOPH_2394 [Spraguea lophii 42_110]